MAVLYGKRRGGRDGRRLDRRFGWRGDGVSVGVAIVPVAAEMVAGAVDVSVDALVSVSVGVSVNVSVDVSDRVRLTSRSTWTSCTAGGVVAEIDAVSKDFSVGVAVRTYVCLASFLIHFNPVGDGGERPIR